VGRHCGTREHDFSDVELSNRQFVLLAKYRQTDRQADGQACSDDDN
jgi:hypothetical protein